MAANRSSRWLPAAPWILGGLVTVAAGFMSIMRFVTCSNTNFDLAFYTRIVWGMAYSDRFNPLIGAHDLGLHLSPVLYLFVPFALILPIPYILLASQSIALGLCVPAVARAAAWKTGSAAAAAVFAAAFALYPAILQIGSNEFHPGTLALAPLLLAFDAIERRKVLRGSMLLALAVLCREDVALVAAAAGILVMLQGGRSRLYGALIIAAALLYFFTYTLLIQPVFLPPHGSIDEHFPGLGHTTKDVMAAMLSHPFETLGRMLTPGKLAYAAGLLFPLAFLSGLSPRWLLAALPPLFINLLSQFPNTTYVQSHYSTLIIPAVFLSAVGGFEKVRGFLRSKLGQSPGSRGIVAAILVVPLLLCSLCGQYLYGALPGARKYEHGSYSFGRAGGILCMYARELKGNKELSVLAPYGALAHLADRRRIYSIDFVHPKPDAAILDIRQRQWIQLEIARWMSPWESAYEKLSADWRYGLWKSNPPYELLWKGKPGGKERVASVSLNRLPRDVRIQDIRWGDSIELEAIEGYLRIDNEEWSGQYKRGIVVRIVFYWKALAKLPDDLFVKARLSGRGNTLIGYFRPTWGIRKTETWKKNEIIRDEQVFVSPGGWPLKEVTAEVMFVRPDGAPYPAEAGMMKLAWPEWEAERDK